MVGGHVTKDEAVLHLTEQLDQAESATDKDETLINQLTRGISMVQKATAKVVSTEVTEGTFLYSEAFDGFFEHGLFRFMC